MILFENEYKKRYKLMNGTARWTILNNFMYEEARRSQTKH